ncbi:MAG: c-type cytochrome [Planctomycetaceae bacterium]|nr:c-type cytochrome [Planctomycetaceae bacterium]
MRRLLILWILPGLFYCTSLTQAQSLEDEFPPGLLGHYSTAQKTIERVDDRIAFSWGTASPDPRLPLGPFSARWSAIQLIRKNANYQYAIFLQGKAELSIDGETVLKASSDQPAWFESDPMELRFGEHEFDLKFEKLGKAAEIKLHWSSDAFPLEPIPRELFFREEPLTSWRQEETGRKIWISRRCQNCHESELDLPRLSAPSLKFAGTFLTPDWIVQKLTDSEISATGKMPHFDLSQQDARDIAAYLNSIAPETKLPSLPKTKLSEQEELSAGETLFHSRGCLACHQMGELGNRDAFAGTALDKIGTKRSTAWIYGWLSDPQSLNAEHRMPVIELSNAERRQLAIYLGSLGTRKIDDKASGDTLRGKELMAQARCANCHEIPGLNSDLAGIPTWTNLPQKDGCLARELSKTKPSYRTQELDRTAVRHYIQSFANPSAAISVWDRGQQLLEAKNCIQCHPRGRSQGIVPVAGKVAQTIESLQGESERLIPPSLDAVGDKLKDAYLLKGVTGAQPRRMDWLEARMPKFSHTDDEKQSLATYLIDSDRIPDNAPDPHIFSVPDDAQPTSEELLQANTLVGPRGFSCVACHSLGDYTPRNVALGTRGSNLLNIGDRMRSSYFIRWTRSPIRIVPGMEMPSIGQKPVKDLLDGDSDKQLAVIWKGLNSPDFTVPTDPASVEQFWVVAPGEPARIVRDVFELKGDTGTGYIPRAFAVGFNNQHSVLFDLDLFEPRVWTYGDFARQRTEGKSWYWNMAGITIETWDSSSSSRFRLQQGDELIPPSKDQSRIGRLQSYRNVEDGIELSYLLTFLLDQKLIEIPVREIWKPIQKSTPGWSRSISIEGNHPLRQNLILKRPGLDYSHSGLISLFTKEKYENQAVVIGNGLTITYRKPESEPFLAPKPKPIVINEATPITSAPGFEGVRLPLRGDIMPTGINWDQQGRMLFTSLKGDLYRATDSNEDGVEDHLELLAEGLSAPYGVIPQGEHSLLVAHKPEILELSDTNHDGTYDRRNIFADGWGHSENYHNWTCGFAKDESGNLYIGLGSDYSDKNRLKDRSRWRGSVLRIKYDGEVEPIAHSFRYPTGVAIDPNGRLFATDNQGVQNTFNELNYIQEGHYYGVPSRHEENRDAPITEPAIQIPHPWTRSVNGLTFVPEDIPALHAISGHGLGAEYNSRLLIRFTIQEVDGVVQGATYYFTKPIEQATPDNFIGPISVAVSKQGEIYVGSILDSGWLGGQNIGAIAKLTPKRMMPNGIRELQATKDGFELKFFQIIDPKEALNPDNYQISGYTREWSGSYATPDKDRHRAEVKSVGLSADGLSVRLFVEGLREGFVYEVTAQNLERDDKEPLFPQTGHYTLHRIPQQ